ncbi:MAG: coenzyme F420-0:L-glutamate ligase [Candidatus ainarchaeum sp.]|jgi:F420-0:gamma-glutamyl ligase|nr:coenzyme F420-0:L-glutamate ligase [Candidatus ainarchaeum sp.]
MELNRNNLGVIAFGVKTGIVTFEDNMVDVVKNSLKKEKDLIDNGDIVCMTEAVVAITQKNYVYLNDVSKEIKEKLNLKEDSTIGIIYPILSRNRFSMILKGIAKTVPKGKIIIQLKFPDDEQGNPITDSKMLHKLDKTFEDKITTDEIGKDRFLHPETGLDYIGFYESIVKKEGCDVEIYLANSTRYLVDKKPDGIIVSNVHHRNDTLNAIKKREYQNVITLQDICSDSKKEAYSEYGLLGSNILDPENEKIKLAPKNGDLVCLDVQKMIKEEFSKDVEVIIYGDGAYKDPESGIYELADPVSAFGVTPGIKNRNRIGVKTKFLMQKLYNDGKSKEEISKIIEEEKEKFVREQKKDSFSAQGTTPRKIENLVSSLADLVSGSADSNTPVVIVRGFI